MVYKTLCAATGSSVSVDDLFTVLMEPNSSQEHADIFKDLLAQLKWQDVTKFGISLLGYACKNGYSDFVKTLLDAKKDSIGDIINHGNPSPLWLAACHGHIDILQQLLHRC